MEINRRDFVKLLGGSLIGFAIGGAGDAMLKLPSAVVPLLYGGPRVETWKMTTCSRCPGKCGLRVRLIDNLPVQVFGNPLSPINNGGICPMGLTSVESLYHPDRLTAPMKKVGGKFQEISYSEAYEMLSNALRSSTDGKAVFVAQTESSFMANLIKEFMDGLNSEKIFIDNFSSNSVLPYGRAASDHPAFVDFERCDFIINFGSQLTEISESPLYFSRAINDFKSKGNQFVTFSPKLTPSAYKTNRWLPVLPEYYEDVALSIAYVVLTDGTYDKDFVQKNFKDFEGFKNLVIEEYRPADVESRTGVPSKDIIEISRKFAGSSAPAAYFDESILHSSNGTRNAYAVIALNALKGFAGYGKLKRQPVTDSGGSKNPDDKKALWNTRKLVGDKSIKLLMVHRSNFIFNSPNSEELRKAVSDISMFVSFSSFIDETSELADLIIPDHDDLEKVDALSSTATGGPVISVQQPVVKPFYNTVHTGDLLVSLIGDLKLSRNWQYKNYEDYLQAYLKPVYKQGKGMLMNQKKPTGLEKSLHQSGWQTTSYSDFDEFWEQMLKYGGWWDPFPETSTFKPAISLTTEQLTRKDGTDNGKRNADAGSLRLNVFRKNLDYKGNMLRNRVLIEQFGMERDVYYETWIEINPDTAKKFSISDRSKVKVRTAKGLFEAVAVYNPAVAPINVDIPFGLGHNGSGKTHGVNPIVYSDDIFDEDTGTPSFSETTVRIG
jgi:anaerobic selenocysteine-containing dehydrogenase